MTSSQISSTIASSRSAQAWTRSGQMYRTVIERSLRGREYFESTWLWSTG
ncbi:hypothetical protein AB0O57_32270 [Streptomyces sp. NPDC091201]